MARTTLHWMSIALLVGGCYTGLPDAPPPDGQLDPGPPGEDTPPPDGVEAECSSEGPGVGPTQLRRLSRAEYENTVALILGVDPQIIPPFLPDERPAGFESNVAHVDPTRASEYQAAAIAIADAVALDSLADCQVESGRACAEAIIRRVAPPLQRRALSDDEVAGYLAVYDEASAGDPEPGLRAVVEALLQSPFFIYHVEQGERDEATGALRLTPAELAARLSYLLWDEPPDPALQDAAASGALRDPAAVEAQARRLLDSPKARPFLARFFVQWFGLDTALRDKTGVTEGLSPELAAAMLAEVHRLVDRVIFEDGGTWPDLLLADSTQIEAELAAIYGVEAPADAAWADLAWDPEQRRGLLSLPAVLAAQSGADARVPIRQGRLTLETLLCTTVPAPPEGAVGKAPPKDPSLTEREYSERLIEIEGCDTCHGLIEPVGWIFGHYDPLGRFIDTEKGKPIDARGVIASTRDPALQGTIDGLVDLATRAAQSEAVQQCMVEHAFAYVHGRATTGEDECARDLAAATLADSGGDLVEMFVSLATSDAFLHLSPMEAQ